jgi:hypothetical protein
MALRAQAMQYLEEIKSANLDVPPPRDTTPIHIEVKVSQAIRKSHKIFQLKPITLHLSLREEIQWKATDGDLEVRLNAHDSPFCGYSFRTGKGGSCFSGIPVKSKIKKTSYKYTVVVATCEGKFIGQGEVFLKSRPKLKLAE